MNHYEQVKTEKKPNNFVLLSRAEKKVVVLVARPRGLVSRIEQKRRQIGFVLKQHFLFRRE